MEIKLGQKVRDSITGLEGMAVSRTVYLYGCARITIQPFETKDGKPADWCSFDEPQLEVISDTPHVAASAVAQERRTGGPQPDIDRGR
jgi:hypothetical protein